MRLKIAEVLQKKIEVHCGTCKNHEKPECTSLCSGYDLWKLSPVHALEIADEILKVKLDPDQAIISKSKLRNLVNVNEYHAQFCGSCPKDVDCTNDQCFKMFVKSLESGMGE